MVRAATRARNRLGITEVVTCCRAAKKLEVREGFVRLFSDPCRCHMGTRTLRPIGGLFRIPTEHRAKTGLSRRTTPVEHQGQARMSRYPREESGNTFSSPWRLRWLRTNC